MLKKLKRIILLYKNAGYNEPVYEKYKSEITFQNKRMLRNTSFIGSIMMLLLTIGAALIPDISKVLPLYFTTVILFSLIFIIINSIKTNNELIVLICNYAFLTVAFFFALGLDIIQKNPTATTICVLLVALPLLFVDKPLRCMIYFMLISVAFMFESSFIKQSPKASVDVLNSASFFIIGVFLGYKHNQMMIRNIVNQKLLENQRDKDTLTTLYNKGAIEHKAVEFLNKMDVTASMMVMDLDNFKYVNDTYGHQVGDEILVKVGDILLSKFRGSDLISRFGGDEFIVFLPMANNKEILIKKAEQILEGIGEIRIQADPDYRAHMCIGIAAYPNDGGSYEELFNNADTAMYEVKQNGKNGYAFYKGNEKKKILIVDDIEINRAVLKATLKSEFDILEANDGHKAMEMLEANKDISLVITDIQMPNMDGIELIKHIRANKAYKRMAIIANTQYGDLKQEEEIFSLGVDDFVYKPSSPRAIQLRVRNLLKIKR